MSAARVMERKRQKIDHASSEEDQLPHSNASERISAHVIYHTLAYSSMSASRLHTGRDEWQRRAELMSFKDTAKKKSPRSVLKVSEGISSLSKRKNSLFNCPSSP